MKRSFISLVVAIFFLSIAACEAAPTLPAVVQTVLPTVQAGVNSGVQTVIPAVQTTIPTIKAGAETAVPAVKTALPSQLRPGEGLPLPGTLVASALDRLSQEEAALAIEAYARDVFSTTVDVTLGRELAGDLNLPISVESGTATALRLSGVTYSGILSDGGASLSLGSGTSGSDLAAGIQQASMGIISFKRTRFMPASAEDALALIHENFPGLLNQPLVLDSDEGGYTFKTKEPADWKLRDGKITLAKSIIRAGVSPGRSYGRINVWALVATGVLAAPFLP